MNQETRDINRKNYGKTNEIDLQRLESYLLFLKSNEVECSKAQIHALRVASQVINN